MTDPLSDIRHYSPTMTISQVLKFCEKKEMTITRAMIQNYVRAGILRPPVNKRLYTHKHLATLVIIDRLKTVFEIPDIKKVIVPYMDEEGLGLDIYMQIHEKTKEFANEWLKKDGGTLFTMSVAAELKNIAKRGAGNEI
ncbi:MAG: DUF1836 domain-containing protein [Defluviitaleaceae bacterium]|nr:DUF1836 domain-containing protein [Defluviitaleaceae bacterium]